MILTSRNIKLLNYLLASFLSLFLLGIKPAQGNEMHTIKTSHFQVEFNASNGTFNIKRTSGLPLIRNATAQFRFSDRTILSTDEHFKIKTRPSSFSDVLGQGKQLQVRLEPQDALPISALLIFKLYEQRKIVCLEVEVNNISNEDLPLQEICPLVVNGQRKTALYFTEKIDHLRLLTHGYSFLDCGDLYFLKDEHFETISNWNVALFDPVAPQALTIGSLKHDATETQIIIGRHPECPSQQNLTGFELRVTCSTNRKHNAMFRYFKTDEKTLLPTGWTQDYTKDGWFNDTTKVHHRYLLPVGGKLSAGPIALIIDSDPFVTLETWADLNRDLNRITLPRPLPMGWCSWPDLFHNINEINILRIADFAKAQHLDDFGFEIIQIDDGFQRQWGDWEGNLYFPRGMKWLADEIKKRGFTPGIWLAPYAISINHKLVEQHPEMLYKNWENQIRTLTYYLGIPIYGLDVSHPKSRDWVKQLFQTASDEWGYHFFKLDYIYDTVLNAIQFHNPYLTKSQVYHQGLSIIRDAVGDETYILECGALSAAGFCDSWRSNADIGASWEELAGVRRTGRAIPKRYYLHGKLFHNDPDHLVVREPLTLDQARVVATNVAMSGGQVLAGDELYKLPPERLQIIKQVLPPYGKAAKPIDLFETNMPGMNVLKIEREFETWWILSVVNWESKPVTKIIDLAQAGLELNTEYWAYEFWEQAFLGKAKDQIQVDLKPTSCKAICLRKILKGPQIIGTDRHITQGGVELSELTRNKSGQEISGVMHGARAHTSHLIVHVPAGYRLVSATTDQLQARVSNPHPKLLMIAIEFGNQTQRTFRLDFVKE